jgi:hypothetical protein
LGAGDSGHILNILPYDKPGFVKLVVVFRTCRVSVGPRSTKE